MSLTEDISKVIENFDKETKALKALDETAVNKKRPERDRVSTRIARHSKEFVGESGKSQNPRERRENHRENN
jgi:hypothetical protein